MKMRMRRKLALCWPALVLPLNLLAQSPMDRGTLIWRADLTGQSQYYWRGIRLNDRFALQPDLVLGVHHHGGSLSLGTRASGDTELEDLFEEYFDEWNLWGQAAIQRGATTATVGVMRFWYRVAGLGWAHTWEAYGSLHQQLGRWAPALQVWSGLETVHGTYVEPSITFYNGANPFAGPGISLKTSLRAGFQLDERNPDAAGVPGPVETGLTFVQLGLTLRVALDIGAVTLVTSFVPALQYNEDPANRVQVDGSMDEWHFSVPIQIGVSLPGRRRQ